MAINFLSSEHIDDKPFWSRALTWAILALGRALIGAFAGLVVTPLTLFIASDYFRLSIFKEPPRSDPAFWYAVGLGVVAFASIAVVSGGAKIGEKAGEVIKGMLAGTAAGVVAGAVLGGMVGHKAGVALGIFCGSPLGALIGGMIGAAPNRCPPRKPAAKDDIPDDELS